MGPDLGKTLMVIGAVVLAVGALIWLNLLPWFGKLPGDIAVRKENFLFHFPFTTCILISVVLTLILSFFRK